MQTLQQLMNKRTCELKRITIPGYVEVEALELLAPSSHACGGLKRHFAQAQPDPLPLEISLRTRYICLQLSYKTPFSQHSQDSYNTLFTGHFCVSPFNWLYLHGTPLPNSLVRPA